MENIEHLKTKIEEARKTLNESVSENAIGNEVYEKSVELDILIESYINVVNPTTTPYN